MSFTQFHHVPLGTPGSQIRLLEPLNGNDASYKISQWDLEAAPPYAAVSYTWGSPSDISVINLNGKTLEVRKNSYYALRQARQYAGTSYIWMDAICINQSDSEEKSAQVNIMGMIYDKAAGVLACIGLHDAASLYLNEWIRAVPLEIPKLLQHAQSSGKSRRLPKDESNQGMAWLLDRAGHVDGVLLQLFRHYSNLIERPYWSRLWILQEIHAGTYRGSLRILCGDSVWDFNALRLLDEIMGWTIWKTQSLRDSDLDKDWALGIGAYPFVLGMTPETKSIFEAVAWFPYFDCYDPRDHVFGLLRTISWREDREPVRADYKKTAYDVLVDILQHFADDGKLWSWEDFKRLSDALGVSLMDDQVQHALRTESGPAVASSECIKLQCYGSSAHVLYVDEEGQMTAAMLSTSRNHDEQSTSFTAFTKQYENLLGDGAKMVMTNGVISAVITARARPGDFIAQLQPMTPIAHILRPITHGSFELIGWALVSHAYVSGEARPRTMTSRGWDWINVVIDLTVDQAIMSTVLAFHTCELDQLLQQIFSARPRGETIIEEMVKEWSSGSGFEAETKPLVLNDSV